MKPEEFSKWGKRLEIEGNLLLKMHELSMAGDYEQAFKIIAKEHLQEIEDFNKVYHVLSNPFIFKKYIEEKEND